MSRFLLAVLHLESLACQLNKRDVQDALKKLPKGLDDTYHEALQRIAHQSPPSIEMASNVLSWISHAYRPLTVEELQCALAVSPDLTAFDEDAITPMDTLVSVCGGLVAFDPQSRIIRLVHYTTQEFLEKIRDSRFPTAQADITRTCLAYLSFDHPRYYDNDYESIRLNLESSPFLTYASQHWRDHMRASPEVDFNEMILKILWQPVKVQCMFQAMDDLKLMEGEVDHDPNVPPLCAAAILGLDSIVLLLLERGADLTESLMSLGRTALTIAVEFAQLEVIKVLIDHGASVNSPDKMRWTPLARSIFAAGDVNQEAAVATARLLLDRGADINFQGGFLALLDQPTSALIVAAAEGLVDLVELLLTYDADVNLRTHRRSTALHEAPPLTPRIFQLLIHHGADLEARDYDGNSTLLSVLGKSSYLDPEDAVRVLLDLGADIHSRNDSGETALFRAAANGLCRMIQVLMEYGADIHARSKLGRSVLFTAVECHYRSDETVSLLLELGVDVHLQDSAGNTALILAAAGDKLDVVKLLLGHGANPHTKNEAGDTALTLAAAKGKPDAVKLLLNHSANPHTKNETGGTALSLSAGNGHSEVHEVLLDHLSQANHASASIEDE